MDYSWRLGVLFFPASRTDLSARRQLYQARWNDSETGLVYRSREGHRIGGGVAYWDAKAKQLVETWPIPHRSAQVGRKKKSLRSLGDCEGILVPGIGVNR